LRWGGQKEGAQRGGKKTAKPFTPAKTSEKNGRGHRASTTLDRFSFQGEDQSGTFQEKREQKPGVGQPSAFNQNHLEGGGDRKARATKKGDRNTRRWAALEQNWDSRGGRLGRFKRLGSQEESISASIPQVKKRREKRPHKTRKPASTIHRRLACK